MDEQIANFLKKCLYVGIFIFAIRWILFSVDSVYDFIGAVGEVISITILVMGTYCSVLWKYNPLEKTPKIMGLYKGTIEYNCNGEFEKKETNVIIKQTLLSTKVQIVTNEITSNTITGTLMEENEQYVLYYTYITNPKSKYSKENPIQYGTCRLLINSTDKLTGTYWTSRKTIGDMELTKICKRNR